MAMEVGRLVATLGLNTTPFTAGITKATSQMKAFSMLAMATGRAMTRFITLPMALAGGAAINTQKKFEASMTKIIGLVGVARTQVEKWNKEVLKMSQITGRGPEELADALYFVTSAGIRGAEAMEVLEMSAKASAAGLGETKVVADLVTSAMNAYGKENLSAAEATDILVASVREGKAEANELAGAMGMVLPIASEFGVSFDQVGAAFAGMTRTGTNARVAATQLKAILSAMASPSMQSAKAMAEYGTNAETFRRTVREKGLITALLDLKSATEGHGDAMAEIFPNIRALMGTLDLLGANMEYNVQIFEALKNSSGSLERAFKEIEGTTQQKLNVALATFKTTLISVGEVMKPLVVGILAKLNDTLLEITGNFQTMTTQQRKVKLRTLAITAAFGPFLLIVSKAITMFSALRTAMIASLGPYGMFIAAMVAAVAIGAKFVRNIETADKVRKRSNEVMRETQSNLVSEAVKIEILFAQLDKATRGSEEWNAIRIKINSTYGEYLDNLITEETSQKKIEEALKKVTAARQADVAAKAYSKEMERLMEEYANSYTKKLKKWSEIVQDGRNELWNEAKKTPVDFAKAMQDGIAKSVEILSESSMSEAHDEISQLGQDVYDTFIGSLENAPKRSAAARSDFMANFFDTLNVKQAAEESIQIVSDAMAGVQSSQGPLTIKYQLEQIDKGVETAKLAEEGLGRETTLITLIGLEKKRNALLDGDLLAINKEILAEYEDELGVLQRIKSSLGAEASAEAAIANLQKARKTLSEGELEANSKAIKQAETKLKKLQLETSGLSEIEKIRGRIALKQEEGLTLDGEALEENNKLIALANKHLQLEELKVSGLNEIEKARKKITILEAYSQYLSGDELEKQKESNRLAEQKARTAELIASGAGDLLILQDELAKLEEDQRQMSVADAAVQQEAIDKKNEEIVLQKEQVAGLNQIAKQEALIARMESKIGTVKDANSQIYRDDLQAEKDRLVELKKLYGALTVIEEVELAIATAKMLQLAATDPVAAAAIGAEIDALEQKKALLEGDFMAGLAFETEGSGDWFKKLNGIIDQIKAAQKLFKKDNDGKESDSLGQQLEEGLELRKSKYGEYFTGILQMASAFTEAMAGLFEAQKQRELSAAGDNALKRAEIEKKYHKKQKRWALAQAIINTALAVTSAALTIPFIPMGLAAMITAGVMGTIQIAKIASTSFAEGGLVYGKTLAEVGEYPGASSNPEVIAPLDKLKDLLRPQMGGMPKVITLKAEGRDLVATINTAQLIQNTY